MQRNATVIKGFLSGGLVATLGGLVGLGGAEFRLPILRSYFRLPTLKAVILNKVTSLVVVFFALGFRSAEIPWTQLHEHMGIIFNLLGGSLVGSWVAAGFAMRIRETTLDKIIITLLLLLALILALEHVLLHGRAEALFDQPLLQLAAGIFAGFWIGAVASVLGVAGGELLIPTIVLLYGVDIKLAGSLSLAVSLPTMLVGIARYTQTQAFVVLKEERSLGLSLVIGSIVGTAIGASLLGMVDSFYLVWFLVVLLLFSAYKIYTHLPKSS